MKKISVTIPTYSYEFVQCSLRGVRVGMEKTQGLDERPS